LSGGREVDETRDFSDFVRAKVQHDTGWRVLGERRRRGKPEARGNLGVWTAGESAAAVANKPHQVEHPPGANTGRKAMRVLAATLILLVSSAAAAQECKTCSMTDACIKAYLKATSEAQSATKQAIRDWKQNLDKKASAELSSRGTLALQDTMETQVRSELEHLKECLGKIR
jgi:hypothetical protein